MIVPLQWPFSFTLNSHYFNHLHEEAKFVTFIINTSKLMVSWSCFHFVPQLIPANRIVQITNRLTI